MDFITNNYQWIFSGIGVSILGWMIAKKIKKKNINQSIKYGSNNIQIGGNYTQRSSNDKTDCK